MRPWALAVLLLACTGPAESAKPDFKPPVAKFRAAAGVVIHVTQTYLTELNRVERDQYIYSRAANREQIRLDQIEEVQVFSKEGIAARLKALDGIAKYIELLNRLATSDAPDQIKAQASNLQTTTQSLSAEIGKLTGEDDMQFKRVASGVLPIIGDLLRGIADRAIEDALRKAIAAGSEPINQVIEAIEQDTLVAYARRRTAASGQRVMTIDQYNREIARGPQADLSRVRVFADQIAAQEDRWEAFMTARPTEGLEALKMANDALLKFAKTPKPGVVDFATLVDAIQWFSDTAVRVGQAAQEISAK